MRTGESKRDTPLMVKTAYLYAMKQTTGLKAQLKACYDDGQLKAVAGDGI